MSDHELLAGHFEEHRICLRAVAYRMLGSLSEADDAVLEAWLRLSRSDTSEIENLGGWLTTVVARVLPEQAALKGRRCAQFVAGTRIVRDRAYTRDGRLTSKSRVVRVCPGSGSSRSISRSTFRSRGRVPSTRSPD
jgi:DNA-directed RNA polymerase specialized sigma24 family protein